MQRPENVIEHGHLTGEVLVAGLAMVAVVPVMKFRRGEQPPQSQELRRTLEWISTDCHPYTNM
jgi:hypothetical protein